MAGGEKPSQIEISTLGWFRLESVGSFWFYKAEVPIPDGGTTAVVLHCEGDAVDAARVARLVCLILGGYRQLLVAVLDRVVELRDAYGVDEPMDREEFCRSARLTQISMAGEGAELTFESMRCLDGFDLVVDVDDALAVERVGFDG